MIARNISDFCFVSSGIINDNTEFLLLVTKDGQIQQMNLSSLENIKTVRLTEDYIQPRFQSCTSGESHIAILDSSGSVWSTGSLIQVNLYWGFSSNNPKYEIKICSLFCKKLLKSGFQITTWELKNLLAFLFLILHTKLNNGKFIVILASYLKDC